MKKKNLRSILRMIDEWKGKLSKNEKERRRGEKISSEDRCTTFILIIMMLFFCSSSTWEQFLILSWSLVFSVWFCFRLNRNNNGLMCGICFGGNMCNPCVCILVRALEYQHLTKVHLCHAHIPFRCCCRSPYFFFFSFSVVHHLYYIKY